MDQSTLMLGEHNALLKKLDEGQVAIFGRLGAIEQRLAERDGARRVGAAIWGSAGGLSGTIIAFLTKTYLLSHK